MPELIAMLIYLSPSIFVAICCCGGVGVGVAGTVTVTTDEVDVEVPIGRVDLVALEGLGLVVLDTLDVQPAMSTENIIRANISPITICLFIVIPSLHDLM